jgi:hypothetical protein
MISKARSCLSFLLLASCAPRTPVGQFGPYHRVNKFLRLERDSVPVYRVKLWRFEDGSPPALQFEFEPPMSVADTAAVIKFDHALWPLFRPYLDSAQVAIAILTATNLRHSGWLWFGKTTFKSFGSIAIREPDGRWHLQGYSDTLPAPDPSGIPRIVEPTGNALPFKTDYPIR